MTEPDSPPPLKTGVKMKKQYAGNKPIAYIGGRNRAWLMECLKCGMRFRRQEKLLLAGKGQCACRSRNTSVVSKYSKYAKNVAALENERTTWRWLRKRFGKMLCKSWKESFHSFVMDMGRKPPGKAICRKNPRLVFSKRNCFWGDNPENQHTIYVTWDGRIHWLEEVPELGSIPVSFVREMQARSKVRYRTGEHLLQAWKKKVIDEAMAKRERAAWEAARVDRLAAKFAKYFERSTDLTSEDRLPLPQRAFRSSEG